MSTITIKDLSVTYLVKKTPIPAVKNISCTFFDKTINVILGFSGSGKTSILRAISNVLEYDGEVLFDGEDSRKAKIKNRKVAYVSQEFALYPHLTVFDNLTYPLKIQKVPYDEINDRVIECARKFEILHLLTRLPKEISIGQQQRVAIAKAIIRHPDIILLDEPLSNVDPLLKEELRHFIKKVIQENNCTAVWVTHDLFDATSVADKVFVMKEGEIIFSGKPLELEKSDNQDIQYIVEELKKNEN